jgi:hypothetical protein
LLLLYHLLRTRKPNFPKRTLGQAEGCGLPCDML